jgi:uncharacterized MAPEG superfamily protein
MKLFRMSVLMLALVLSICSGPAHAQQEVNPDHFDQPRAASIEARGSGRASLHQAATKKDRANPKAASAHLYKMNQRQHVRRMHGEEAFGGH